MVAGKYPLQKPNHSGQASAGEVEAAKVSATGGANMHSAAKHLSKRGDQSDVKGKAIA
jgi:hypothetical protein